jgi:hypothetical protein
MKAYVTLALLALMGWLAACAGAPQASATPSVEQRERAWLDQKITAYRIEVLVVRSVWHAQSHRITVQAGRVESATATCIPAPTEAGKCKVEDFDAEDYTVAGLFRQAYAQTQSEYAAWTTTTFDPSYGFPQQISYNHPEMIDEDWAWRVTAFEVLK